MMPTFRRHRAMKARMLASSASQRKLKDGPVMI
jgi:hypothetical protein